MNKFEGYEEEAERELPLSKIKHWMKTGDIQFRVPHKDLDLEDALLKLAKKFHGLSDEDRYSQDSMYVDEIHAARLKDGGILINWAVVAWFIPFSEHSYFTSTIDITLPGDDRGLLK